MRFFLTYITLLLASPLFSQQTLLNKIWVGDAGNYLKFDTSAVRSECHFENHGKKDFFVRAYHYSVIGDTLRIYERDLYTTVNHDFLITTFTRDKLKLTSLNQNSRLLAFTEVPKKILLFRNQPKVYTDTISFQKILFSSTTCFGSCPAMSMEIDNKKQVKFAGGRYAVKKGSYTAVLPDTLYNELLQTLAISELDKLENNGETNIDAPTYKLEVHYNNHVKFITTSFMPYAIEELLKYLLNLPKQLELNEAEPMEILFSE